MCNPRGAVLSTPGIRSLRAPPQPAAEYTRYVVAFCPTQQPKVNASKQNTPRK